MRDSRLVPILLASLIAASVSIPLAGSASITPPIEDGLMRGEPGLVTAQVVVPATPSSCSCGAFLCKGKEYPACTIQCGAPAAASCECGYCERTLGSPSTGKVGPVANLCECR